MEAWTLGLQEFTGVGAGRLERVVCSGSGGVSAQAGMHAMGCGWPNPSYNIRASLVR